MKKQLLHLSLGLCMILLFGLQSAIAQEKKSSKVTITITEDDKVTSDTTFELKEGQDPEMIKKVVSHMAGEDIHVSHDSEKEMNGINIDSIREAHKDAKVLVIKNKNGEVEVKELGDDDDIEMFISGDEHGTHQKMMFIESDISHTQGEDCNGKEQKIEVIIHGNEDMEWTEKDGEKVNVYVIKKGDNDVMVEKKIVVEIEEEHESDAKSETETKEEKKKKK